MAVYKPTYCYPYLEPVDLTISEGTKYFTCQVDTSNIAISGYKMELYDENNNKVFPIDNVNKISPVTELGDDEYIGLNGTELRIPFIQRWSEKIANSYNAIYFKAKESVDYYQSGDFDTTAVALNGIQLYKIDTETGVFKEAVMIDGSYLFVGDRFIAGSTLYEVTYAQEGGSFFNTTKLSSGDIVYIKGGDNHAGKCYQWNDRLQVSETKDVWCDINEKSIAVSNKGQTYKWKVTLYSGNRGATRGKDDNRGDSIPYIDYTNMADDEFNTILSSGTILGSTADRIQGPISDKIYAKQWLQLGYLDNENKFQQVGIRTYIESYSQSLGCIYPISGDSRGFSNDSLYPTDGSHAATHFAIYKYSNNKEQITSQNSVDYAIDLTLTSIGATYTKSSSSSASNYSYIVKGKEAIDTFNAACEEKGNVPLCDYTLKGSGTDAEYTPVYAGSSVLVFNPQGGKGNELTGYFTISFKMDEGVPMFTFDMAYSYRQVSSYIGKVFFVVGGKFANLNIVSKAEVTGVNDVASLDFPLTFVEEEPLEIYPNNESTTGKFYGEIFKNTVKGTEGTVYVSPFVGLQAGARFYVSDGTVIKATDVDTSVWRVTYNTAEGSKTYSAIEALKYELRTNFKSSDETPFYAYDSPRLVPWATQGLLVKSSTGETFLLEYQGQVLTVTTNVTMDVKGRFVEVYGQYLQAQNVSWTSYRWLLVDQYGQTIQDTGKKYDGLMRTTFYGLDGPTPADVKEGTVLPNQYYVVLLVDDELGNSLALGMQLKVTVEPRSLPVMFTGEFDCKIQAVRLKIQDYGYPTLSTDQENKAVALAGDKGVTYTDGTTEIPGSVAITGANNSWLAENQVAIPTTGAQLKHFFAKGTTEIADLASAPKKLATNKEGNVEFHTEFKLDANYCGEFFKYGVDIFDNFGNTKKLYLSLGLPNNFNLSVDKPDKSKSTLNSNRAHVTCTLSCGGVSASWIGYRLLNYNDKQEAYSLQPKSWIDGNGNLAPTTSSTTDVVLQYRKGLEYLDFKHPFDTSGNELQDCTNINERFNTKDKRNIGVCCLEKPIPDKQHYNVWTDLERKQVQTPAGYRVVQTNDISKWDDTKYWVEGWDDGTDTEMVQMKRHPSIEGCVLKVDCYMKGIDDFYNTESFGITYSDTPQHQWTITAGAAKNAKIILILTTEA